MDEFYRTELDRALSEQHYGIIAFRMDHEACTKHAAFALIDLLEHQQLRVELSNRGYKACSVADSESEVFETLEDLLLARSSMYGQRRTEVLVARLSQLAEAEYSKRSTLDDL